jgi:hypothetical protein
MEWLTNRVSFAAIAPKRVAVRRFLKNALWLYAMLAAS